MNIFVRVFWAHGADDCQWHSKGDHAGQERESHPVCGQAGALVIIQGELGGQGVIRHIDQGGGQVEEEISSGVVGSQGKLGIEWRAVSSAAKVRAKGSQPKSR